MPASTDAISPRVLEIIDSLDTVCTPRITCPKPSFRIQDLDQNAPFTDNLNNVSIISDKTRQAYNLFQDLWNKFLGSFQKV